MLRQIFGILGLLVYCCGVLFYCCGVAFLAVLLVCSAYNYNLVLGVSVIFLSLGCVGALLEEYQNN